jgi:hypothetical protein
VPARTLVYLCAYLPEPGRALADRSDDAWGPGFGASMERDELGRSYWPDLAAAAHDLQYPPEAAALAARLRPQARKPSIEPSPLVALPEVDSAFLMCTDDYAVPPDFQRRMARDELGVEPIELQSGHSPMLAVPRELADALESLL